MFIIFFTFALFASGIFVNKLLLTVLPPTLLVGLRMFSAGLILMIYTWRGHKANIQTLKEDWLLLGGIALFTTFLPALFKAYALSKLTTAHATLLGSVDPFVTALYAYLIWGEKLTPTKWAGILLGCFGVTLTLNISAVGLKASLPLYIPQLSALLAVILSRFGWTVVQMQLKKNRYTPAELNSITMLMSGALALAFSQWLDPVKEIVISSPLNFSLLLGYSVLVGNVIAYTLYGYMLKHNNATLVSLAGFSIPIFAGIYSRLFLGEKFTYMFAISATTIFAGLLLFYFDELKKTRGWRF